MRKVVQLALALSLLQLADPGRLQAQIEIPIRSENAWFVVEVTVNGTPLQFILDTGAGISAVSEGMMARLGLPNLGRAQVSGASGSQTVGVSRIDALDFGGRSRRAVQVIVLEDNTITPYGGEREGFEAYDGVLGVDIFGAWDLVIDPVAERMILLEPGTVPAAEFGGRLGPAIPVTVVGSRHITIPVEVEGVQMPAVFDTGSRRMILSGAGARASDLETRPAAENDTSGGVGDQTVAMEDADFRVSAGGTDFGLLPGHVADLPVFRALGLTGPVLLMGNPALKGCLMHISYRLNQVRLCTVPTA